MRKITKRTAVIAAVAVVAVGGAGAAFAAWSLNSSHDVATQAGSAQPLEVSGLQVVGVLVPGTPVSVKFTAKNGNSFPVTVSNITFSDVHTSNEATCPVNNLVPSSTTLPADLAFTAGETKYDLVYANALKLKTDPDTGCQNANFAFKVNLVVASNATS